MTKKSIQDIHSSALTAQGLQQKSYESAALTVELLSKKLREIEKVPGDAIRITCLHSNKVILLAMLDSIPGMVGVSLGTKGGDAQFLFQVDDFEVDSEYILGLIGKYTRKGPDES